MTERKAVAGIATSDSRITPLNKGLGAFEHPLAPEDSAKLGWNLLREDLSLPTAVLYQEKLLHNLHWMQQFITTYGVKLAPHGKTTMAPKLFDLQLKGGAWGITLATAHQVAVAYQHGVRRVLLANQLVGKQNMAIISRLLEDEAFDFYCLVDSAEQVEQLGRFYRAKGQRLQVLIELGVEGGRTGVRDAEQLQSVLNALDAWREQLVLCGVEIYEGVLKDEASIRDFLHRAVDITRKLALEKRFGGQRILLTGAGSAWYDVVADVFSKAELGDSVDVVLRPGCYLTHDVGIYREAQQEILKRNPIAKQMHSSLQPALQLWAYVQSVPEKERAIVALGKRDAAFDAGLPTPVLRYRPGTAAPAAVPAGWELTKMMDQHAYLQIAEGDDIRVGDMIGFDISHPCLTFDKWRCLPMLNSDYDVVDVVQTFF
ncbi:MULTISPECIES: amino acid deaminase [Acidobacteriaceae]|uniref:amino acid deaminase n=1 Tax=Acidobacteriaceae TaxID=204434 RepID=UPI00131D5BD3|nr:MULTISPECIES: amino acid deaminase [Acidobacteriaceae]MDW5264637.1 amino acid deaminase [Edaphobacter sp.]